MTFKEKVQSSLMMIIKKSSNRYTTLEEMSQMKMNHKINQLTIESIYLRDDLVECYEKIQKF